MNLLATKMPNLPVQVGFQWAQAHLAKLLPRFLIACRALDVRQICHLFIWHRSFAALPRVFHSVASTTKPDGTLTNADEH